MRTRTITTATLIAATALLATATPAEASTPQTLAIAYAKSKLGQAYRYGGAGEKYWDCSELTQRSYKAAGKALPRTAQGQWNSARVAHVSLAHRKVGDLVFIGRSSTGIYHVGIYVGMVAGHGRMINANSAPYRGYKVVSAPIDEYVKGSPKAYYGHVR